MKLVATSPVSPDPQNDVESFVVSRAQFDFLGRVARDINPDMPMAFAGGHIIRTLLERIENSGIDLTAASTEEEITRIAARELRERDRERHRTRS